MIYNLFTKASLSLYGGNGCTQQYGVIFFPTVCMYQLSRKLIFLIICSFGPIELFAIDREHL